MPAAGPTLHPADRRRLRTALRRWFANNGRALPFRETADPWAILVSEVILQQTQVSRVVPAWRAFTDAFPTPGALADASPADALRRWAGLGYNRRALNLWRAARAIVERHGGAVPADVRQLVALPGVGPYTAAAVAAMAFGRPHAAVDTNVRRVISRLCFGTIATADAPESVSPALIQSAAQKLLDVRSPGAWTYALMDLGSSHCRPRMPDCSGCPLRPWCVFATSGCAREPVRSPKVNGSAPSKVRFEGSSRWLRGRIVDRLRPLPSDAWLRFDSTLGPHPVQRIQAATIALVAEGMLEQRADGAVRLSSGDA